MTEEEWRETAAAQAVLTFAFFMSSVLMNIIGGTVGGLVVKGLSWLVKAASQQEGQPTPDALASALNPERDEALRNGLLVIAAWSAFEACIEDFCKGILQADVSIVGTKEFGRVKVPVSELLAPEDERLDTVFQAMQDFVGKRAGITEFEGLLTLLGLGGDVPDVISRAIYAANMVRNVWAHRGGTADLKFTKKAAHLGYTQGQLVAVTQDQLTEYVSAIMSYAMIILNRHRAQYGLSPMPLSEDGQNNPIKDAYRAMYAPAQDL